MKYVMMLVLVMCVAQAPAQTMKEVWSAMPDSVMPLLSKNNRLDCVDYWEAGQQGDVKNRLEGKVSILFMNEDSLAVADTESSSYEMKLKKGERGDLLSITVRRVVKTGDITDWTERIYSPSWRLLNERLAPKEVFEENLMKGTIYL